MKIWNNNTHYNVSGLNQLFKIPSTHKIRMLDLSNEKIDAGILLTRDFRMLKILYLDNTQVQAVSALVSLTKLKIYGL